MTGMQFKNKVLVLGLVAGALAAAYALGLVFSPTNVQKRRSEQPLLPGFKTEAVARIEVSGDQGGTIQVELADKSWRVMIGGSPFPASAERVGWFLDSMAGLRRARLVSANPDSWASFGVSDQAKTRIRLDDASGKRLLDLIVGSSEPGQRGNFARLEGSNEVVLLSRSLSNYLDGSLSYWSHLKFFPDELTGGAVMRISVRASLSFPDGTQRKLAYTLIRSSEGGRKWKVVEPAGKTAAVLDDKAVDRMASTLAEFEGNEFVPGRPATGLEAPSAEVLFSTEDNRDYRILVGSRSGEDQYFAKVDGGEYVYLIPEWRVRTATQPLEEMQPK
jgi:hypothetical protein